MLKNGLAYSGFLITFCSFGELWFYSEVYRFKSASPLARRSATKRWLRNKTMKELLDRLGSYNLFNYLLPGVIFAAIATSLTGHSLIQSDLLVGAFVYYFLGLIISRIGSILVEPILKKIGFVKFSSYRDYVSASKNDELIPTLYRDYVSASKNDELIPTLSEAKARKGS